MRADEMLSSRLRRGFQIPSRRVRGTGVDNQPPVCGAECGLRDPTGKGPGG